MTLPPVNSETFAKIYHCRSRAKISNQCHNYAFWQNFVWWNEFCTSNTFLLVLFWKRKGVKYSFGHKRIFFLGPHSAIGIWFRIFSFFFTGPDHVKTHLCEMLELWRNYVTEKSWTVLINNEGLVTVTYLFIYAGPVELLGTGAIRIRFKKFASKDLARGFRNSFFT